MNIKLIPIGVVHVSVSDEEVKESLEGVSGVIEVFDEFVEGLEGVDGFTHIIIIAYLHKVPEELRKTLKVRPKRLLKLGLKLEELPQVGVFVTDSPHRPNPIALTIVKLVRREGKFLYVEGLDLFDGTPILDIRPYTPDRSIREFSVPKWYEELFNRVRRPLSDKIVI